MRELSCDALMHINNTIQKDKQFEIFTIKYVFRYLLLFTKNNPPQVAMWHHC